MTFLHLIHSSHPAAVFRAWLAVRQVARLRQEMPGVHTTEARARAGGARLRQLEATWGGKGEYVASSRHLGPSNIKGLKRSPKGTTINDCPKPWASANLRKTSSASALGGTVPWQGPQYPEPLNVKSQAFNPGFYILANPSRPSLEDLNPRTQPETAPQALRL